MPKLVFLHGFLGVKEDWDEMIAVLGKHYDCMAIDLPGHGEEPYCEGILEKVKGTLEHCSQKPILIGYSMGGRIAIQLQEHASALIILSGHYGLQTEEEKRERLERDRVWSEKLLTLPIKTFLEEWYSQPIFQGADTASLIERRAQQHPHNLSQALLQLSLAHQPYSDAFPCKTLFLYGENDLKYRALYSRLPKTVTVSQVEKSGHAILLDNPAGCSEKILHWLQDAHIG